MGKNQSVMSDILVRVRGREVACVLRIPWLMLNCLCHNADCHPMNLFTMTIFIYFIYFIIYYVYCVVKYF